MNDDPEVDEASSLVANETRQDASFTSPPATDYHFFDPRAEIDHLAGNLPHWRQKGVLYFVTFRSADSLPREKLRAWEEEKRLWLATHPAPWDKRTHDEYLERFPRRIQRWLDAGSGACLLGRSPLAAIVTTALRHFEGERYQLDAHVVASNHVHVLLVPKPGVELSAIVHSWKSFSASAINRAVGCSGRFWQPETYDHLVRDSTALHRIRSCIRNHPQPRSPTST